MTITPLPPPLGDRRLRPSFSSLPVIDDYGKVMLKRAMADDIQVVEAAKASFAVEVTEMGEHEEGVLRYMMREHHGTPFEHAVFTFVVKCPIFVAREWFRHRMSSFNEWSGRYSKLAPEFYIPENVRTQIGKPGSYTFDVIEEERAGLARARMIASYQVAWDNYEAMLESGVAKELARLVLPVSIYTQFFWTVNARSLMNFLALRNAETAQYEIRQFAIAVEQFFAASMPLTWQAFNDYGRIVP